MEAKIVLCDDLVFSIATEFIENEAVGMTKQDCEINSFKRLSKELKKMFPRSSICLLGASLYAYGLVFDICKKNKWEFLIRYKDGSIPSLAEEYNEINKMGESEEEILEIEQIYKRKPKAKEIHKMRWVNQLCYQNHISSLQASQNRFIRFLHLQG